MFYGSWFQLGTQVLLALYATVGLPTWLSYAYNKQLHIVNQSGVIRLFEVQIKIKRV